MSKDELQALDNIDETITALRLLDDARQMESDAITACQIEAQIELCKSRLYDFACLFAEFTPIVGTVTT